MASTVIGGSITIEGDLLSDEDVIIYGTLRGHVTVEGALSVASSGCIEALIRAESVEIAGRVTGNMTADNKVEIAGGGRAIGDVRAQRILIADGAVFKGNVDMGVPDNGRR